VIRKAKKIKQINLNIKVVIRLLKLRTKILRPRKLTKQPLKRVTQSKKAAIRHPRLKIRQ